MASTWCAKQRFHNNNNNNNSNTNNNCSKYYYHHQQQQQHHHHYQFKICNSVHYHTIQINQPTRCNSFSSLLLDVYLQLNVFRAPSRPSSEAQQLQ
jgi:hypothetical protein